MQRLTILVYGLFAYLIFLASFLYAVGFVGGFWATPMMTYGHLLFASVVTVYVLCAIALEERDLVAYHGDAYSTYRQEVSMLLPLPKRRTPGGNES